MPTKRSYGSCGLTRNPDRGPEVVMAGYGTRDVFNLNELRWREGPELPQYLYLSSSVQLEDTFLLLGGWNGGEDTDAIYRYDNLGQDWVLEEQRLPLPLEQAGALAVPKETVDCRR